MRAVRKRVFGEAKQSRKGTTEEREPLIEESSRELEMRLSWSYSCSPQRTYDMLNEAVLHAGLSIEDDKITWGVLCREVSAGTMDVSRGELQAYSDPFLGCLFGLLNLNYPQQAILHRES